MYKYMSFYLVLIYDWSHQDWGCHINLTKEQLDDLIKEKSITELSKFHIYKTPTEIQEVKPIIKFDEVSNND